MRLAEIIEAIAHAPPAKLHQVEQLLWDASDKGNKDSDKDENRLISISGAARILALGRATVYSLINTGRLDTVELNGSRRVTMRSIHKFVAGERPANDLTAAVIAASKVKYASAKANKGGGCFI